MRRRRSGDLNGFNDRIGGVIMLSQILRDARKYEETVERGIDGKLRPGFHLSARVG